MDAASLRAFALRSRAEVEREKRDFWAHRHAAQGSRATVGASHALYEYVRRVRPDYPTEADRALDLEEHVLLKRLIDRASRGLVVR